MFIKYKKIYYPQVVDNFSCKKLNMWYNILMNNRKGAVLICRKANQTKNIPASLNKWL